MRVRRDHGKTEPHHPMFANIVIFAVAVGLVLTYLAVMHCCWLGRDNTPSNT